MRRKIRPEAVCDCTGRPPWPVMTRLHVGGLNRYYLCPECGAIREEICQPDGTITAVHIHRTPEALSQAVRQQARQLRQQPKAKQMSFL